MSNRHYIGGTVAMQQEDGECDERKSIFRHISDVAKGTPSGFHTKITVQQDFMQAKMDRLKAMYAPKKESSP